MFYLFCLISHTWHREFQQIRDKKPTGPKSLLCRGGERLLWPQAVLAPAGLHHQDRGQRGPGGDPGHQALEVQQLLLPLLPAGGEGCPCSQHLTVQLLQGGREEFRGSQLPLSPGTVGRPLSRHSRFCSLCASSFPWDLALLTAHTKLWDLVMSLQPSDTPEHCLPWHRQRAATVQESAGWKLPGGHGGLWVWLGSSSLRRLSLPSMDQPLQGTHLWEMAEHGSKLLGVKNTDPIEHWIFPPYFFDFPLFTHLSCVVKMFYRLAHPRAFLALILVRIFKEKVLW